MQWNLSGVMPISWSRTWKVVVWPPSRFSVAVIAFVHAAWIHNRFRVSQGQTAYERATGRSYSGRVAQYGERVMAFIKQEKKADPKWLPAIWLGKAVSNDAHIVADHGVILVTRDVW